MIVVVVVVVEDQRDVTGVNHGMEERKKRPEEEGGRPGEAGRLCRSCAFMQGLIRSIILLTGR